MRPCSGHTSCSRQAWPPSRFDSYRRSFGLRSFPVVSSVASGRIEFVSPVLIEPTFLRTIPSLPVALHEALLARSYFPFLAGSTAREGLSPSRARSLSSALAILARREFVPRHALDAVACCHGASSAR